MVNSSTVSVETLQQLGIAARQQGDHVRAIDFFRQAVEISPKSAACHVNLGMVFRSAKQLDAAAASFRLALELDPNHAEAHNRLGTILKQQGKLDEAAKAHGRALQIRPDYAGAHTNLGSVLKAQGRLDQAALAHQRALQINPQFSAAHFNLGNVLYTQQRLSDSASSYRRALQIDPNFVQAHTSLGNVLRDQGEHEQAIAAHRNALQLAPDYAEAHRNLGDAFRAQGNLALAADSYRRAIEIEPDFAQAHSNLGHVLCRQRQVDEAVAAHRQALRIEPQNAENHVSLGSALRDRGQLQEAATCYERALQLKPDHAEANWNWATGRRFSSRDRHEIERLEGLLSKATMSSTDRATFHFTLGKMYDDIRQWQAAFANYRKGNQLSDPEFDTDIWKDRVDLLIDLFPGKMPDAKKLPGRNHRLPIFIVGMPRSGTTLVEQVLASHPLVFGAGELDEIGQLSSDLGAEMVGQGGYPRCLATMEESVGSRMADKYLRRLADLSGDAPRVIDKMPGNFVHLGLISLILPGATVIHARRNAKDACLSCFFQRFTEVPFASNLRTLGICYRHYERLMDHWRHVLPKTMYEVDYEDLVRDTEQVARDLLEFCGLNWHSDCLRFFDSSRNVQTASNWQVRQPMYQTSIDRYKNYEEFLGPLNDALSGSP